ncbi:hypothetical protein [Shewanella violacea]|uniref:Uncharacterized protein n=1 Tax=Shewanella violacea (strain JCM 10179 / CIP 106290 / LMG 19151 / DSS12) TaxID=637905 RepID=D4ZDZ3_SHEVD|nr:hypothetical protein [Shewanella violacea]BAJ04054.1 hypothetical protein SVI_4083 [Shewanella violacea DSS12]
MNCCSELTNKYDGKSVKDIPELQSKLEELDTDYKNWITIFKCSVCSQIWIEKYKSTGHGDVPEVYKHNE